MGKSVKEPLGSGEAPTYPRAQGSSASMCKMVA